MFEFIPAVRPVTVLAMLPGGSGGVPSPSVGASGGTHLGHLAANPAPAAGVSSGLVVLVSLVVLGLVAAVIWSRHRWPGSSRVDARAWELTSRSSAALIAAAPGPKAGRS